MASILSVQYLTHDVICLRASKPAGISYTPGQAIDVSIDKPGWQDALRAFTFTSLPDDDFVEFTIKIYSEHNGLTAALAKLQPGDNIILHDVFGDIQYNGPGMFIAGGAGITPFIAIFKQLAMQNNVAGNQLLFANKTKADIIREDWFKELLGGQFVNILSNEMIEGYEQGFVSPALIKKYNATLSGYFYLCGPPPMMAAVEAAFKVLGIADEKIIKESF